MLNNKEKTQQAMRDIAHRTRISAFLYLVIFAIVVGFTPFYSDHNTFIVSVGLILLISTVVRGVAAWTYSFFYFNHPALWKVVHDAGLLIQAANLQH